MAYLKSVEQGWKLLIGLGAGTGLVFILRWYWWRVNAWSEISAMAASFVTSIALHLAAVDAGDTSSRDYAKAMLITVAVTTSVWLARHLAHPARDRRGPGPVLPAGSGPGGRAGGGSRGGWASETTASPGGRFRWVNWVAGVVAVYSAVFAVGQFLTGSTRQGWLYCAASHCGFLVDPA